MKRVARGAGAESAAGSDGEGQTGAQGACFRASRFSTHARRAPDRARAGPRAKRLARLLALVSAILLGLAQSAPVYAGEPQRVQVVGNHPIRESERARVNPRDEAIAGALWEGVSRVAMTLLEDEGDAESLASDSDDGDATAPPDRTTRFRELFGSNILPYTRGFRIVEDRGERPVLFTEDPGVRSEYLVVVEVAVDVDRVRDALARTGLLAPRDGARTDGRTVELELVGIRRYPGLQRVLETLRQRLGVVRVETLELSPARQLLRLEGPLGPDELAARLERLDSAELILEPVEIDREGGRIRVLAQWREPLPESEQEGEPGIAPATIDR
ncbi:MAG: hypothetical protein R3F35_01915 [Myxococcota bacterium]